MVACKHMLVVQPPTELSSQGSKEGAQSEHVMHIPVGNVMLSFERGLMDLLTTFAKFNNKKR